MDLELTWGRSWKWRVKRSPVGPLQHCLCGYDGAYRNGGHMFEQGGPSGGYGFLCAATMVGL